MLQIASSQFNAVSCQDLSRGGWRQKGIELRTGVGPAMMHASAAAASAAAAALVRASTSSANENGFLIILR